MSYSKLIYDSRPTLQSTPQLNGFTDSYTPTYSQFHQKQHQRQQNACTSYTPLSPTPLHPQNKNIYEDPAQPKRARKYCPLSKEKQSKLVSQCTLRQGQQYAKSIQYTNYLKKMVDGAKSQFQIVKQMKCTRNNNIYLPISLNQVRSLSKHKKNGQQLQKSAQGKEYTPIQENINYSVEFNFSIDQLSKIQEKQVVVYSNKYELVLTPNKKQTSMQKANKINKANILIQDINYQRQDIIKLLTQKCMKSPVNYSISNKVMNKTKKENVQNKQNQQQNKTVTVIEYKQRTFTPTKFVNYQQVNFITGSKQKIKNKKNNNSQQKINHKYGKSDTKKIIEEMQTLRPSNKIQNNYIHEASFFPYKQSQLVNDSTKRINIYDLDFKLQRPDTHSDVRQSNNQALKHSNTSQRYKNFTSNEDCIKTAKSKNKYKREPREQRQYQCRWRQSQLKRSSSKSVSKGKLSIVSASSRAHHR